jgi:hypothetical protein
MLLYVVSYNETDCRLYSHPAQKSKRTSIVPTREARQTAAFRLRCRCAVNTKHASATENLLRLAPRQLRA